MRNYKFTTNYLGSNNWAQCFCEGVLIWEAEIPWDLVEPVAQDLKDNKSVNVEIEFMTDEEMAEYCD